MTHPWKRASSPPWAICTVDTRHNLALIRTGPQCNRSELLRTLYDLCSVADSAPPFRSEAGGWIVAAPIVTDLQALAGHRGTYVKVQERKT